MYSSALLWLIRTSFPGPVLDTLSGAVRVHGKFCDKRCGAKIRPVAEVHSETRHTQSNNRPTRSFLFPLRRSCFALQRVANVAFVNRRSDKSLIVSVPSTRSLADSASVSEVLLEGRGGMTGLEGRFPVDRSAFCTCHITRSVIFKLKGLARTQFRRVLMSALFVLALLRFLSWHRW
jgi:hypothetical protein